MKQHAIHCSPQLPPQRRGEHGVTMVLMALAMTGILAMAALSIDVVTLYLANAEAQRSADTAALAGARVLSISGMTGDPQNVTSSWTPACTLASQIATAVATQNDIAGAPASTVTVSFLAKDNSNCTSAGAFGVNPEVQVKIQRTSLPTFFARIWGRKGSTVSATATAEVFNSSNSGAFSASADIVPVQPRCVKPWIVPNLDPALWANKPPGKFVSTSDGSIISPGVKQLGGGVMVIGESFTLAADCNEDAGDCKLPAGGEGIDNNPPTAPDNNTLQYVPALVQGPAIAVPSCAVGKGHDAYQRAIAGCDQGTVYACGTLNGATVNLNINPGGTDGDTLNAVQCLTNSLSGSTDDMDVLVTNGGGKNPPAVFPFQIKAGDGNPLVKNKLVAADAVITSSSSIVTVPIYDNGGAKFTSNQPTMTIVGFLQVFINDFNADGQGNPKVTVLNVSGCSNAATNPAVTGTSPVPVRLITPP